MANVESTNPPDAEEWSRLDLLVLWDVLGEGQSVPVPLELINPSAQEIASLFLGLEQTYRTVALALGYPPHFVKVKSVNNPELKFTLEGAGEAINALRELILALPRLVASLFRPRVALELAALEATVQKRKFEADASVAMADKAEADLRRLKAESEAAALRQEMSFLPIQADPDAHALLGDLVKQMQSADPAKRKGFMGASARYLASTRGFEPAGGISLVPGVALPSDQVQAGGPSRTKKGSNVHKRSGGTSSARPTSVFRDPGS